MLNGLSSLQYPRFKLAIVCLLSLNILFFAMFDTLTSVFDQIVWLSLLILYEMEANGITIASESTLNKARDALIMVLILVFVSYAKSQEWLDVINFLLWVALIALLEVEVRWPHTILARPTAYRWAKMTIFSGLLLTVIAWAWQSVWLDAYDAALWIVAFITIESDLHQFMARKST